MIHLSSFFRILETGVALIHVHLCAKLRVRAIRRILGIRESASRITKRSHTTLLPPRVIPLPGKRPLVRTGPGPAIPTDTTPLRNHGRELTKGSI